MPTQQGKLKKIQEFLEEYENNDAIFAAPAVETDRQKKIRQDQHCKRQKKKDISHRHRNNQERREQGASGA